MTWKTQSSLVRKSRNSSKSVSTVLTYRRRKSRKRESKRTASIPTGASPMPTRTLIQTSGKKCSNSTTTSRITKTANLLTRTLFWSWCSPLKTKSAMKSPSLLRSFMRWALMCAWYRATILWPPRAPPSKLASFISLRQTRNMFAWLENSSWKSSRRIQARPHLKISSRIPSILKIRSTSSSRLSWTARSSPDATPTKRSPLLLP